MLTGRQKGRPFSVRIWKVVIGNENFVDNLNFIAFDKKWMINVF